MSAPTPAWLTSLIEATEKYAADVANGRESTAFTCPQLEYTNAEDHEHPERICQWCFHPRNSAECNFAQQHTPYVEMFARQSSAYTIETIPRPWCTRYSSYHPTSGPHFGRSASSPEFGYFRGNEPLDTRPPELWIDQLHDAVGGDW